MDAIECIRTRKSIRKFRPETVSKELLTDVVETALRSPSYKNSQPWEAIIVSGDKKKSLTEMLIRLLESGKAPEPDLPEPISWPPEINERINNHLTKRGAYFGIDLMSPDLKVKAKAANFRFYNAPHGIFLFQDSSLNEWSIFDAGLFAQSLMLAAHAKGLGTVPQGFLVDYAKDIKVFLNIPSTKRLLLGISIGYPDWEDKANGYVSNRVTVDEILKFVE